MNNEIKYNPISVFRSFTFVIVVFGMICQPFLETFMFIVESNYELVELDTKKDSNEKENQEDDTKEEKNKLQVANFYHQSYRSITFQNLHSIQSNFKDITKDIPSPPPDLA